MTAVKFVVCEECKRPVQLSNAVGFGQPPRYFHPIRCFEIELQRVRARIDKAFASAGGRR